MLTIDNARNSMQQIEEAVNSSKVAILATTKVAENRLSVTGSKRLAHRMIGELHFTNAAIPKAVVEAFESLAKKKKGWSAGRRCRGSGQNRHVSQGWDK